MESETGAVAPTELLYTTDAYIQEFEAAVLAVRGNALALECSAFYPGGGGQMADRGLLHWNGHALSVVALRKQDGVVWHEVEAAEAEEDGPLPAAGERVRGTLDWAFRHRMMRTHTALHTLCGVIFRDFGAQVTGGQMYPDRARMDFSLETFTPDLAQLIEQTVNETLAAGHSIKVYSLPREQAFAIPDLIRTKISLLPPGIQTVRIVEIEGVDLQADGGTHVANTREVGQIQVLKTENKGKYNKRMEITLVGEG